MLIFPWYAQIFSSVFYISEILIYAETYFSCFSYCHFPSTVIAAFIHPLICSFLTVSNKIFSLKIPINFNIPPTNFH